MFNVEDYLEKCLESLVNQTIGLENLEIILIDDYSTDRTLEIAEKYVNNYPCIRLFKQAINQGSGIARNVGLREASAPFISFVDADDFISLNTYEYAIEIFQSTNVDILIYEYEYFSGTNKMYKRNPSEKLFTVDKEIRDIQDYPEIIFATSVCNKVFSKNVLEGLIFTNSQIEDALFSTLTTIKAKKVYVTNQFKYFYRKREEKHKPSKTDSYFLNKESYLDHLVLNEEINELAIEYPAYKSMIDWFNVRSLEPFLRSILTKSFFSHSEKKQYFNRAKRILSSSESQCIQKLEKRISQNTIEHLKNHNYYGFACLTLIHMICNSLVIKLKTKSKIILKITSVLICVVLAQVLKINKKYRDVWLITERGDEARDNGYSFFKYLRNSYPNINAYYLISTNNKEEYSKVNIHGNVIRYRSMMHKMLFVNAIFLVTAHRGSIEPWNYASYKKYLSFFSPNQKYIFLQHGITKDDVSNVLGRNNTLFDLFITGAKPEYDYISKIFGYTNNEVVYTGFARFDDLYDEKIEKKKQILLMPTWRKELAWSQVENKYENFMHSDYYRRFQSFLENDRLANILESQDYSLVFYLHYEMQMFSECFQSENPKIIIAKKENYDIQSLLRESAILITDYSSVYFDFAYMRKPVIYYQFDREQFRQKHYKKGYFSYEEHGFGPVLNQEKDVYDSLDYILSSNAQIDNVYQTRVNQFFAFNDRNNCERIYRSIINLK